MNKEEYFRSTGYVPEQDDLQRANCKKAGEPMHSCCGWCKEHDLPIFMCGCSLEDKTGQMWKPWRLKAYK